MRELALPAPGNDRQLGDQVARLVALPLDRARPLSLTDAKAIKHAAGCTVTTSR